MNLFVEAPCFDSIKRGKIVIQYDIFTTNDHYGSYDPLFGNNFM